MSLLHPLLSCPRTRQCLSDQTSRCPWITLDLPVPAGSHKRCKKAGFEVKMPPFEQYQAAKPKAFSTPPHNFSGRQKQARRAPIIHTYRCILRIVSVARTHEMLHNLSNETSRTTFCAHGAAQKTAKTRYNFLKIKPPSAPIQPWFLMAC